MNLYTIERHHQLLDIWRDLGVRHLRVTHVDFHCDLRGLMVDRPRQLAYRIRDVREGLDEGNYLRHAIEEGLVKRVRWVHGTPGGRMHDVNCVKYLNDITAIPHRCMLALKRRAPFALEYDVQTIDQWQGLEENDFLDVDWDTFAGLDLPPHEIDRRVEDFFEKDFRRRPIGVVVCYSPYHSHDSREAFQAFVERLASLLNAQVVDVPFLERPQPEPWRQRLIPASLYERLQSQYYRVMLGLKRLGIE